MFITYNPQLLIMPHNPESVYSNTSDSDDSDTKPKCWLCKTGIVGTWTYLGKFNSHATGCPRCALLLKVIEQLRPGWIDAKKPEGGRIGITYKHHFEDREFVPIPGLIKLFELPPEDEGADGEMKERTEKAWKRLVDRGEGGMGRVYKALAIVPENGGRRRPVGFGGDLGS